MTYTFEDFEKEMHDSGLWTQFSESDINLARDNPDAGMSLISYKKDWNNATNDDQRALANAGANEVRQSYGDYTGGGDGGSFYLEPTSPSSYEREDYSNPYAGRIENQLDLLETPYSYDVESDPSYGSYSKAYAREGQRATENAMGSAASMTGGQLSTAAMTAGQQAGQYYSSQMADKIPELEAQAYNRYMQNKTADIQILSALDSLNNTEFNQYSNNRNFDYSQILDDITHDSQREQRDYDREMYLDERDYGRTMDQQALDLAEQETERARLEDRAMTMAAMGDYSLLLELGYTQEQVDLLTKGWGIQNPALNWGLNPSGYQTLLGSVGGSGGYQTLPGSVGGSGSPQTLPGEVGGSGTPQTLQQAVRDELSKGTPAKDIKTMIGQAFTDPTQKAYAEKILDEAVRGSQYI